MQIYDVLIIGGGPAGMTAALYARRAGLSVALAERMSFGGQAALTDTIANYPGISAANGFELCEAMRAQAEAAGADLVYDDITALKLYGTVKSAVLAGGGTLSAGAVILAMGAARRRLNAEGEDALVGAGVSYCAVCDGAFFRGKTVITVGGGDTAVGDALYLANLAEKVYIVHRRDTFRAAAAETARLDGQFNIEIVWDSVVTALQSRDGALSGAEIENVKTGEKRILTASGLFVAVGQLPATDILKNGEKRGVKLDESGYIVTDEQMRTNIKGVFAAGDIRRKPLRQIVTACADGAVAAESARLYNQELAAKRCKRCGIENK
jgi:thioredoxin reductase (NADPH)